MTSIQCLLNYSIFDIEQIMYCTILYCNVLYCTAQYSVLYCTVLKCTEMYISVPCHIELYFIILHCLYYVMLYCTVFTLQYSKGKQICSYLDFCFKKYNLIKLIILCMPDTYAIYTFKRPTDLARASK